MTIAETLKGLIFKKAPATMRRDSRFLAGGRRGGESENPYLAARRTWNDHVHGVVASRQAAQMMGLLGLLIGLAAVGGMIYIGSLSKIVPYVVEVDKLGRAVAAGAVERAGPVDRRSIRTAAADFVANARLVTPDVALQRKAVFGVYAMLAPNDPATVKMNEWLNGSDDASPFKRAAKEMVDVQIGSVLEQTADTLQVDWVETTRDRQGVPLTPPVRMRALVTVYTAEPTTNTTEEQVRSNPLGIYARDFSWSKQL
jgi:type IV secretory pathway TrbF-like protein